MAKTKLKRKYKKILKYILIILIMIILITIPLLFFRKSNQNNNKMINLIGKNIEEITKYAKNNNLELEIKKEYNSDIEEGFLIEQSIKENTILKGKEKLNVTISLGKIDTKKYVELGVDELGKVPIMMYHGIQNLTNDETSYTGGNVDYYGYQRTKEAFINDLEFYYKSNYRMIRLIDYVNGKIDVELGYSPIVLTFDDGLENNIKVTGIDDNGDIIIDPNSAVGILESFKNKYPNYNVTATFFLNGGLFQQTNYNERILKWLVENGYDIGNHSYNHANFEKTTPEETVTEIGKMYKKLEGIIPGKYVNIVALPFGSPTEITHINRQYILKGNYENFLYETKAALRVGWESNLSPFSKNFDPTFIKRIRAYDNKGTDFDIEENFRLLEKNRFISDGDFKKITVKQKDINYISENNKLDVITY